MSTASVEPYAQGQLWRGTADDEHFIQFYEDDFTLLCSLKGYIEYHLNRGAAAIVIATEPHLHALQQQCLAQGLDLAAAGQLGQFVPLDACVTLNKLFVDGEPDARRFSALIEPLLHQTAALYPKIVSFDEMVALLWNQGRHAAAVRIEGFWKELARNHRFGQYCAYPMSRAEQGRAPQSRVTELPSTKVERDGTARADATARLARVAGMQMEARLLAGDEPVSSLAPTKVTEDRALTDFFEHAPLPMHRVRPDGIIEWANPAELQFLGYRRDEYVGRHLTDFLVEAEILEHIIAGQTVRERSCRLRCKDGSFKRALLDYSPQWQNGQLIHSRGCMREMPSKLHPSSEQQLRLLAEHVAGAIVTVSLDGVVTSWNASAERLLGYAADEVIGRSMSRLTLGEQRPVERETIEAVLRDGRMRQIETIRVAKDGRALTVELTLSALHDTDGRIRDICQIAHDITERVVREKALQRQIERKNEFMATLGHELRNPLAPIANALTLLRRMTGGDAATTSSLCDLMDRQVANIRGLLDSLHDVSRLNRSSLCFHREAIPLSLVVENALAKHTSAVKAKQLQMRISLPNDALWMLGDSARLTQALAHLLDNAIKASSDGGQIEVHASADASFVKLRVRDHGSGIPAALLPQIFDLLGSTELGIRRAGSGLGVGLTLVRHIIEAHGGTVCAYSESQAAGAEFVITLPLLSQAQVESDSSPHAVVAESART